jgi:predicted helicase
VWSGITERKIASAYDASSTFPLYLAPGGTFDANGGREDRTTNLTAAVVGLFAETLGLAFEGERGDLRTTFGAEDLLEYVYGIFHSPQYRARYDHQLRIDFLGHLRSHDEIGLVRVGMLPAPATKALHATLLWALFRTP